MLELKVLHLMEQLFLQELLPFQKHIAQEEILFQFHHYELYAQEQLSTSPYIASACIYAENGEKLITVSWQKEAGNE